MELTITQQGIIPGPQRSSAATPSGSARKKGGIPRPILKRILLLAEKNGRDQKVGITSAV